MKQISPEQLKEVKEHLNKTITLNKLLKQAVMNVHINDQENLITLNWMENLELTSIEPQFTFFQNYQYLILCCQGWIKDEKIQEQMQVGESEINKQDWKTYFVSYYNIKLCEYEQENECKFMQDKDKMENNYLFYDYIVVAKPNSQLCEIKLLKKQQRQSSIFVILNQNSNPFANDVSNTIFNFCEEFTYCGQKMQFKFKYQSQFKVRLDGMKKCQLYLTIENERKIICQTQIKLLQRISKNGVDLFIKGFSIYKYKNAEDHYSIQLYNQKVKVPKQIKQITFEKDHISIQFNQ